MKKLILLFGVGIISLGLYSQKISTYVAAGDSIEALTSTFWISGAELSGTPATVVIRPKPLFDAKEDLLVNSAGLRGALSDETGTGAAVFGTAPTITTSITIGEATITEAELEILDGATLSTDELNHVDGVTSGVQTQLDARLLLADTVDLGTVAKILTDTSTYFAWTIGGETADTALFTTNDVIAAVKWNGSHTLNMTRITGVMGSGSKDIDIALLADVNYKDGTPTTMLNADLTITSSTTGSTTTSFADATLAPGEWLWIRVDQCTAQPLQCVITIDGYLTE